jgi:hypothetical protein
MPRLNKRTVKFIRLIWAMPQMKIMALLTRHADAGALCHIAEALCDISERIGGNERADQSIGDSLIKIGSRIGQQ